MAIYHRFLPRAAIFHPRSAPILIVTADDWKTFQLAENQHSRHVLIVTFPPYSRPHYLFRPLVTRRLSLPTALRL